MMHSILVVDDDLSMQYVLKRILEKQGHEIYLACSLAEGRSYAQERCFAAVFLDVGLPDGDGMDAIGDFIQSPGHPQVVMITGLGSEDDAERAILSGAYDYISKHASMDEILVTLDQALTLWESSQDHGGDDGADSVERNFRRERLCGSSDSFMRSLDLTAQYARVDSNVLILGETGTGKELFARTIHENSARRSSPFVTVDCASLPDTLAQSIIFGHVKGAFSSADVSHRGLIAEAENGTLFLDEVGELPLDVQKIFLRVLQEKTCRSVGSTRDIACDFRLVAATNRNLLKMVEEGRFRKDLYFRLQTCILELSPLRKRKGDIEELIVLFVERYCKFYKQPLKTCTPSFMQILTRYPWPGNVRELMHAIEYAISASRFSDSLAVHHLPGKVRIHGSREKFIENTAKHHYVPKALSCSSTDLFDKEDFPPFNEYKDIVFCQLEKNYVYQIYNLSNGDVQGMMRLSGLSKSRCYALMKKHFPA